MLGIISVAKNSERQDVNDKTKPKPSIDLMYFTLIWVPVLCY